MDTTVENDKPATVRYSEEFNDEQAEVTYQSSDGIRFRIHAVYLKAHTEGLAPPDVSSLQEIVQLTEPAGILGMLFKFIYPTRPLALALEMDFQVLHDLAEAAEKYQVFPAMYECNLRMRATLPKHAVSVLGYALKHDYFDLADEAAPKAIDERLPKVIDSIPSEFCMPWLKYYDMWLEAQQRALVTHAPLSGVYMSTVGRLSQSLSALQTYVVIRGAKAKALSKLPAKVDIEMLREWGSKIKGDVDAIPKFSATMAGKGPLQSTNKDPITTVVQDGDVVIRSSDGVDHSANLEVLLACSMGLYDPAVNISQVSESSSTIRLLLQLLKPLRSPDFQNLAFYELKDLAFAAERYAAHQARAVCRVFMRKALPNNATDIFIYAATFSYLEILDLAIPLLMGPAHIFEEALKHLPSSLVLPWARYYLRWQDAGRELIAEALHQSSTVSKYDSYQGANKKGYCSCDQLFLETHLAGTMDRLLREPAALRDLEDLFPTSVACPDAQRVFLACGEKAENLINDIPLFSSFI